MLETETLEKKLSLNKAETQGIEFSSTGKEILKGESFLKWEMYLFSNSDDTPYTPDWWQSLYLKNEDDFFITNKSRRIGWSYITADKGLGRALDRARTNYTKQFVSYSLEDAIEKIKTAEEHYDSIPDYMKPKKIISRTKTRLEFLDAGGRSVSRLISLPCKQPRGKGGDISLDEFAFHAKDTQIYTAALAVIARGGSLEIGSTPFGNKGLFYDIFNDENTYDEFKRWSIPWYFSGALCKDVVNAVKDKNLTTEDKVMKYGTLQLQRIFRSYAIDDFKQEFECYYRDDKAAFITLEMILACTPSGGSDNSDEDTIEVYEYKDLDEFILAYDPVKHGNLYAGYDVGRTNDASELIIIGYNNDLKTKSVIFRKSMKKTGFDAQEDVLNRLMTRLPVQRMCIDKTGLGMELAEHMEEHYKRRVEGCMFTNEFKEILANNAWLGFDRKEFRLPHDKDMQLQIHSIKKIITENKHSRFDCDSNKDNHADSFWAMCLANYAIDAGPTSVVHKSKFYEQVKKRNEEDGDHVRGESQATAMSRLYRHYNVKR
jgi:phage FluMu gp28-like protein